MGKITGLWLTAMTLLAVVAVSTAPMFGPGVAAGANHETATIEVTDASATKTNSSGTHDAPFSVVSDMEFLVEFTAENTGDVDGTKQVTITADDEQVDQVDVAVGGGQQTTESVPITLEDTGEYDIAVDGVSAGTVTVVDPPNITVTETTVNRTSVTRGEHIEVTHTLKNTGGKAGELTITPALQDTDTGESQIVNELDVAVGGGETETTSWTLNTGSLDDLPAGEYELRAGGDSNPTLTIEEPTRFTVEYSRLRDESTVTDEPVELTVRMANPRDGDGSATEAVVLQADGSEIATRTVEIENGETETLVFSPNFDSAGTYDLTINGESVGTVEVADEGSIQIQDAGLMDTQVNTDTDTGSHGSNKLETWVIVENTGGQAGTITLPIEVGGTEVGTQSVAVPAGETVNETLGYRLDGAVDEGDHEVTVGDVTAGTLTVGTPDIQVTDASWNRTTITRGDAAELTVTARNDGTVTAGQEFRVETETEVVDAVSFDLAPGDSGTDTYVRTFNEPGTYQFTVGSETQTVTVEQPATFAVSDRALNTTSVSEGESVTVTATVTNTGDQPGTYEIPLTVADERANAAELQLEPGESTPVSFTEPFTAVGTYPIDLDGERVGTVRVSEAATFETTAVDLNRTDVVTGEPIAVTATVRNEGDQTGTADVRLQGDGTTIDTQSVTLDGGGETTVTFVQSFSDAGTRAIAVDNQFGARVTVSEPATFEISNAAVSSESVIQGGAVELTATVTNTGGQAGSVTGNFSVANSVVESREVTLAGGEATEITYEHVFNNSGNYVVSINGERAGTVTVKEPAAFDTAAVDLNRTSARTGEPIEVTATVVNDGDQTGTSPVRLQTNADIVDTTNVTLPGGQQTEVTFVYVFESGGEYDVAVNGDSGGNISVTQPATFEVRDAKLSTQSAETGESVDVTATVANVGTESGNYTAALAESNQTLKSKTIGPIAGGETATVSFSISFDDEGNRSLSIGNTPTETL
ncbi:CARDB domain-containing protein, partial [Haloarcula rubripromontorii]|uniref:CARDB domain-containing protein n=1 Tax=Haloarcula rubripromontorii TaxID=1705562 RepID=UPI00345C265E